MTEQTTALSVKASNCRLLCQQMIQDYQTLNAYLDLSGKAAFHTIRGVKSPDHAKAIALTCLMEGMTIIEFDQKYDLVDGRPAKKAITIQAEFETAGGKIKWLNLGEDGKEARARFTYGDHDLEIAYTIEEGKRQVGASRFEKPGGNWQTNPGAMLRARLVTKALRIIAPNVIAGVYSTEELQDLPVLKVEVLKTAPQEPVEEKEPKPVQPEDPQPDQALESSPESLEERGKQLLATNDMECNPHAEQAKTEPQAAEAEPEPAPEPEPAKPAEPAEPLIEGNYPVNPPANRISREQLKELKEIIETMGWKEKWQAKLMTMYEAKELSAPAAHVMTRAQADNVLGKLRPVYQKHMRETASQSN